MTGRQSRRRTIRAVERGWRLEMLATSQPRPGPRGAESRLTMYITPVGPYGHAGEGVELKDRGKRK